MTPQEFADGEHQANDITYPEEKSKIRAEIARVSYREQIEDLFRDTEAGQNYGAFGILPINTLR